MSEKSISLIRSEFKAASLDELPQLISAYEWYISKRTFKRFIYKYSLPFQYEKDIIEKFFTKHPDHIKIAEFEELVK